MKRIIPFIVIILLLLPMCTAYADFGSYSGGSDYGGGGSDWSSSGSDWGGSSGLGGFAYIFAGGSGSFIPIAIIVVVIIIAVMARKGKLRNRYSGNSRAPGAMPTPMSSLSSVESFRERDPAFSEAMMSEKISNLYVKMQYAWTDKNLEPLRPYLTDELYARTERQLSPMIQRKQTNYVERIAVLNVSIMGWQPDGQNDIIVARLNTRITDYTTDDRTGKVISGSKDKELFMEYEWTLARKCGMITPLEDGISEISCPNCGAPMNVAQSAKCQYCNTVVKNSDYDWVVSSIKGLSQRTA